MDCYSKNCYRDCVEKHKCPTEEKEEQKEEVSNDQKEEEPGVQNGDVCNVEDDLEDENMEDPDAQFPDGCDPTTDPDICEDPPFPEGGGDVSYLPIAPIVYPCGNFDPSTDEESDPDAEDPPLTPEPTPEPDPPPTPPESDPENIGSDYGDIDPSEEPDIPGLEPDLITNPILPGIGPVPPEEEKEPEPEPEPEVEDDTGPTPPLDPDNQIMQDLDELIEEGYKVIDEGNQIIADMEPGGDWDWDGVPNKDDPDVDDDGIPNVDDPDPLGNPVTFPPGTIPVPPAGVVVDTIEPPVGIIRKRVRPDEKPDDDTEPEPPSTKPRPNPQPLPEPNILEQPGVQIIPQPETKPDPILADPGPIDPPIEEAKPPPQPEPQPEPEKPPDPRLIEPAVPPPDAAPGPEPTEVVPCRHDDVQPDEPLPDTEEELRKKFTNEINDLINAYRKKQDPPLKPLAPVDILNDAANELAEDNGDTGKISHYDSNGDDHIKRAKKHGYDSTWIRENVTPFDPQKDGPNEVFQTWIDSLEGHNENLLDPKLEHSGIGFDPRGFAVWIGGKGGVSLSATSRRMVDILRSEGANYDLCEREPPDQQTQVLENNDPLPSAECELHNSQVSAPENIQTDGFYWKCPQGADTSNLPKVDSQGNECEKIYYGPSLVWSCPEGTPQQAPIDTTAPQSCATKLRETLYSLAEQERKDMVQFVEEYNNGLVAARSGNDRNGPNDGSRWGCDGTHVEVTRPDGTKVIIDPSRGENYNPLTQQPIACGSGASDATCARILEKIPGHPFKDPCS